MKTDKAHLLTYYQTTKNETEMFKKHPEGKKTHYKQENSKWIRSLLRSPEDNWMASSKC